MKKRTPAKVSLFHGKDKKDRLQGILTKVGIKKFEHARRQLAGLARLKPSQVSDGDTIEYLARGINATVEYLRDQKESHEEEDR